MSIYRENRPHFQKCCAIYLYDISGLAAKRFFYAGLGVIARQGWQKQKVGVLFIGSRLGGAEKWCRLVFWTVPPP